MEMDIYKLINPVGVIDYLGEIYETLDEEDKKFIRDNKEPLGKSLLLFLEIECRDMLFTFLTENFNEIKKQIEINERNLKP